MAVKKGTFAANTSTGNQAVTGVGFQPTLVLFFGTTQTAAARGGNGASIFSGAATSSSNRWACAAGSKDAVLAGLTGRTQTTAKCIRVLLDATPTSLDAEADFVSMDADGFTINWSDAPASAWLIHYVAISNVSAKCGILTARTGTTGTTAYTGVGFQPNAVLFNTITANTEPFAPATPFAYGWGAMTGASARATAWMYDQAANPSNSQRYERSSLAISVGNNTAPLCEADFSALGVDGFTLNWTTVHPTYDARVPYVALNAGAVKAGVETQKTSTGTKATTGLGFHPDSLLVFGVEQAASASVDTTAARFALGAATAAAEGAVHVQAVDNQATSDTYQSSVTDKLLFHGSTTGTDAEADLSSFDSDGFTLNWSTADATAREFAYLALLTTPPGSTGTLYASGTHVGVVCGADKYAQVTLAYDHPNTTDSVSTLKVERSADGTTWADVSSAGHIVITALGSNDFKVVDRRPDYGSQSVARGGTVYYRVSPKNGAGTGTATSSVNLTAAGDKHAVRTANYVVLSAEMAGSHIPSSLANNRVYPGEYLMSVALGYLEDGVAQYLTDATNQFNYIKNTITDANGVIKFPDYADVRADFHARTCLHAADAARLLRRAGATSLATSIITQCDIWAKAMLDTLNSGTAYGSVTVAGYRPEAGATTRANTTAYTANTSRITVGGYAYRCITSGTSAGSAPSFSTTVGASVTDGTVTWVNLGPVTTSWASGSYVAGAIVRPTVANSRTYRALNAGTSGGSEPTWPTTTGGTVVDGAITWRETSAAGLAFYETYNPTSPYAQTSVSLTELTLNQQVEIGAMFALLCDDADSGFNTAGAYRTEALSVISGVVAYATPLQSSTGAIPIGDGAGFNGPNCSTLYGGYVSESLTLIYGLTGSQHAAHALFIDRALTWLDGFATEPLTGIGTNGVANTPSISELLFRNGAQYLRGHTRNVEEIAYSAAFWDSATDNWGDTYTVNGGITPRTPKHAIWEAEAILRGALPVVVPSGIASTEAVGTPAITAPGGPFTISPTGIASTSQVGQPTIAITPGSPTDLEGFVLDDLDLNTTGLYRLEEFVLGPPPKRYEWIANNDIDGADLLRDPSQDNRPWTLKVRLMADTRDEAQAAHDAIVAKLEKAERNGRDGITAVWTPVDSSTSYDVIVLSGETTDFPIAVESGYFVNKPLITFQGLAKPGLYLPEQTIGPITSSLPLIEIELPDVPGQLPAEATITVGDAATKSRRHVTWGLEQRYYDATTPSSLVLDADDMTTSGYAGSLTTRAGSYGANVVRVTDLPTNRWTAVAGLTSQPHVGVFRVPVRGHGDSSTSLRISWRAGDGPFTAYPAITVPVDGWFEIDLGAVVIPPAPIGAQTWDCRIEAMSTAIGSDLDLDFASLIPAGEGFGRARAVAGNDAAGVVNGFDDFGSGVDGDPLNGEAADGGGTWATAGATGDFQYSDGLPTADLAAARGTSVVEGSPRIMVLGSTSYTDTQAQIARATTPGGISWGGKPGGVIARYVDASNYVYAKRTPSGPFQLGYVLAGTPVSLASATHVPPASGALEAIILLIYASGRAIARLVDAYGNEQAYLEASSSVLATGGALASGKPGIFDQSTDTAAVNRFYDGFTHSVPAPEIVALNADRTLAFRHDTVRRENATGTAYGEPGMYRGGPAYVPPSGDDNLPSRVVIVARRNDIDESTSDDVTDATTVTITLRPRNLWPS